MTTRRIHRLTAALALSVLSTVPATSQAVLGSAVPPPPPLAARYRLTLISAWPQDGSGEEGCGNGGEEVVSGVVTRTGPDRYEGAFSRHTTLRFCGTHGSSGAGCALVLQGEGTVTAAGTVVPDERSPSGRALRLVWTPEPGHTVRVEGVCAAEFKQRTAEMYLNVPHGVEFALPPAGAALSGQAPRTERLEGYAWTVTID